MVDFRGITPFWIKVRWVDVFEWPNFESNKAILEMSAKFLATTNKVICILTYN
jgi:hypothetical protein